MIFKVSGGDTCARWCRVVEFKEVSWYVSCALESRTAVWLIIRLAKLHARKVVKELGFEEGLIYLPGEPTRLYEDSDMSPKFRQRK